MIPQQKISQQKKENFQERQDQKKENSENFNRFVSQEYQAIEVFLGSNGDRLPNAPLYPLIGGKKIPEILPIPEVENQEIIPYVASSIFDETRKQAYLYQSVAQKILYQKGVELDLTYPANIHSVCHCQRSKTYINASGVVGIDLKTTPTPIEYEKDTVESTKASYSGLQYCKNPWVCPVCSTMLSHHRGKEVFQAVEWAYNKGFKAIMVTYTFSHTKADKLAEIVSKHEQAVSFLRSHRVYRELLKAINYQGMIRCLEVTHGANGWHLHTHELLFVDKKANAQSIKQTIFKVWESACLKHNLLPQYKLEHFRKHAIDIKDNATSDDYLVKFLKFSISNEMTAAEKKDHQGRSPYDLLKMSYNTETKKIVKKYSDRFVEFALAMKGKRQLVWSKNLKKLVGIEESEPATEKVRAINLTSEVWNIILKQNARYAVLDLAQSPWKACAFDANLDSFNHVTAIQAVQALVFKLGGAEERFILVPPKPEPEPEPEEKEKKPGVDLRAIAAQYDGCGGQVQIYSMPERKPKKDSRYDIKLKALLQQSCFQDEAGEKYTYIDVVGELKQARINDIEAVRAKRIDKAERVLERQLQRLKSEKAIDKAQRRCIEKIAKANEIAEGRLKKL